MNQEQDPIADLGADRVDEAEFVFVLSSYFHSSTQVTPNEVLYPDSESNYALKIIYDDHQLIKILSGPGLKKEDLDIIRRKVTDELITSSGKAIGNVVLFSYGYAVRGWWKYNDQFQILPAPEKAPLPAFQMADWPFTLQFVFRKSSEWMVNNLRRQRTARHLELLLNSLLETSIHGISLNPQHYWVLLPHEDPQQWQSAYCQEMYSVPDFQAETEVFAPTDSLEPINAVDPQVYYSERGIGPDRGVRIPTNLSVSMDRFFSLPRNEQSRYLRASYWLQHSHIVYPRSRSASYIALINAVEALMPSEQPSARCDKCGKSLGKGPNKRFQEFLETYAPVSSSNDRRERDKLYALRSALSHGDKLLRSDVELDWGLHPTTTDERQTYEVAFHSGRIALVNWLNSNSR